MNAVTPLPMPLSGSRVNLRSSSGRGWNGFGAALLGISAGTHRIPAMPHHRIGVHVGAPVMARCLCEQRRYARVQAHGDADVIPAGLNGQWTDEGDCTILSIWISESFTRKTLEQLELKSCEAGIRPQLQMRDPRFQHLAWALQAELEAGDASDPLYAESLCTAMVVRLIDSGGGIATLEGRGRTLAPRTATRVTDFIESNLDQRLTLDELAALAQLSVPHFKVLFRETLGMPVHRYVVQRRVERAKLLLLQGKLSTSQVALETGFSHQSHMAHWMNRLLGLTPREIVKDGGRRFNSLRQLRHVQRAQHRKFHDESMTDISGTPLAPTSVRSTDYGLWALTFSYVLSQFFRSYVAVISTQLIGDFHFTPQMFGWFSGAFFLVFALAQIPVGLMFDRYGVRYPTAVLMSVGTLSAGVVSVTTDPRLVIIAQAGIGIGCAPVFMGLLNYVLRHGVGPRDVRSITTASAIGMSGGLLAAFPLSWATANFGWRPVMALSAMLMLLATLGVIFFVRRRDERPLLAAPQSQVSSGRATSPARARGGLWTLMPVCLAMSVGGTFRTSWGGPYLADVFGFDILARGNAMTVMSIAGIGASFCIPFLVRRWSPRSLSLGWQAAGVLAALLLAAMPQRSPVLSVAAICLLLSVGCIHPLVMSQARAIIAPGKLGLGLGLLNSLVFLGVALASSVFGLIAQEARMTGVSNADLYSRLFVVTAVPLVVGAIAYWFSPGGARK